MTREEAITNLKMIRVAFVEPITEEQAKLIDDTFDMAIKALKTPPNEDWEKYSENLYDKAYNRGRLDGLKCATEIIEELLDKEA